MSLKKIGGIVVIISLTALVAVFFIKKASHQNELIPLKRASIKEAIFGIGTVQTHHKFAFKTGITSTIEALYVKEGDSVQKGQKLAKISAGPLVVAPFAGTVTALPYSEKENAFPDTPVVQVEDLKNLYINASLEQEGVLRVKQQSPVVLTFENMKQKTFHGKVRSIYPKAGQFIAVIDTDERLPEEIIPSMTADVAIEVAQKENVLLAPLRSLNGGKISILRDGKQMKIPVQIGIRDQEWAEIISGDIQDGDQAVIPQ